MKKILNKISIGMLLSTLILIGCKKKEQVVSPPVIGNEFLTTVKIRFQNAAIASDTLWAVWKDVSGGSNPPDTSKAVINLKKGSTYHATVSFYDETKNPAVEVNIRDKANYHTYWFFKTGVMSTHLTTTATDHDTNNPPIFLGLSQDFVTDATVSAGRLEAVLRHQPNSKNGTYAPGSTDSDVFFTLNITP